MIAVTMTVKHPLICRHEVTVQEKLERFLVQVLDYLDH